MAFIILSVLMYPYFLAQNLELDNGLLKVKIDLNSGGAITFLSKSYSLENLINNFDKGRHIQQSYYAGDPIDRISEGQHASWSPWPWNPIQAGDVFGNASIVLDSSNTDGVIYTKTLPLLWDMNNEPAEAFMEQWTRLEDYTVKVQCKLTCQRTDFLWNIKIRHQEIPAVYTISRLSNQYTYVGDAPWTHAALTKIEHTGPPWTYWGSGTSNPGYIEGWAANMDDSDFGLGVFCKDAELFVGGLNGTPGGGDLDPSTAYLAPLCSLALVNNTILEWEYFLIVGSLEEIRNKVYNIHNSSLSASTWSLYP